MPALYEIGQEVIIKPVSEQSLSLRDSSILPYAGKTGTVSNYYWIAPPAGTVFYLYTVRVNNSKKEIVLYEDEITPVSKTIPKSSQEQGGDTTRRINRT